MGFYKEEKQQIEIRIEILKMVEKWLWKKKANNTKDNFSIFKNDAYKMSWLTLPQLSSTTKYKLNVNPFVDYFIDLLTFLHEKLHCNL